MALSAERARVIALALAILTIGGAGAVLAGPGRGLRADIAAQRKDVHAQRDLLGEQVETTEDLLAVARTQARTTARLLATARQQRRALGLALQLQRELLAEAQGTRHDVEHLSAIAEELLRVTEELLGQAREINRKIPLPPTSRA